MKTLLFVLVPIVAFALPEPNQWRGPQRDGIFPATGLLREWPKEGPKLAWQIAGLGRGLSSVAIGGGKRFTISQRKRGDKGRGPGKESAAVIAADGFLYFRYQDGTMALIEATPSGYAEKGAFKLPHVDGPAWSHPVIHDGQLFIRDQDALMCYDLRPR
jgi:hypothetical protein